ncbi:transcription elongation factor GreA [bacterium]|nr:transcription elongation factor GreA [bacterium]
MAENQKYMLTKEGIAELKKELDELLNVKRPEIIKQIAEARAQGDLSENADYDAAKAQQGVIEGRIAEINSILQNAIVIDEVTNEQNEANNAEDSVRVGKEVKVKDLRADKKGQIRTYKIVGTIEADPFNNAISNESPIAKSLYGHKAKEKVQIQGIENPYLVEIVSVSEINENKDRK